ncbi:sensor histidine kinase [Marilutibacter aestuarii]|uniref:sensor histidine kinase n=1 Tax=Marilutibacter aestuarii TaxID=1706195 RepID=UPI001144284A|nr:sensor histidine kinase [Lysobacter aestuarii]
MLLRDDTDLWVGYFGGGTSHLHHGRLEHYPPGPGFPAGAVYRLAEDGEGTVWAATSGGLAAWRGGDWARIGEAEGVPAGPVFWVHVDRSETLWAATGERLLRRRPGSPRFEASDFDIGIEAVMAEADDGQMWLSDATHGTRRILQQDGRFSAEAAPALADIAAKRMAVARDGQLWLTDARNGGAVRWTPDRGVEAFGRRDGLGSDMAVPVLEDIEGNMWIGTNLGLNRFRRRDAMMLAPTLETAHHGLGLATSRGGMVVGTGERLLRERDGTWRDAMAIPEVLSIAGGTGDELWLLGRALWRLRGARLEEVPLPTPTAVTTYDVLAMAAAPDGALWVSLLDRGLFRHAAGAWQRVLPTTTLQPRVLAFDAAGRLWMAERHGQVAWWRDGHFRRMTREGLEMGDVTALYPGRRHFLVAGERGLARFDGIRFRTLGANAVPELGAVTGIAEDADGGLWLNGIRGVVQLPHREATRAFARLQPPSIRLFDERDGLLGVAVQSSSTPTLLKGRDGRVWVSTNQGVAWIDPARVGRNTHAPRVMMRSISTANTEFPAGPRVVLPPRTRNVEIGYGATSLGVPERVAFRYRLLGVDDGWQEAGPRRQVFYTNLGPGEYRFEVMAANEDGVWSLAPASQALYIQPAFQQTRGFAVLCVLAIVALLWLAYYLRLRQLGMHIRGRLQERHAERERIARELHDTLLQSIQGLILRFQAVADTLPSLDPARSAMEHALQRADEVLVEGRDRVLDLRATAPDAGHLEELLGQVAAELREPGGPDIEVSAQGDAEALDPIVRDELYRIGREAMLNAYRHAGAGRICATVEYGRRELRLRIFDDGVGIADDTLERGGRPGHWGLNGMRERASRIGARLRIWSRAGAGTEVELRIDAGSAYRPCLRSSRWSWLRTAFGGTPS